MKAINIEKRACHVSGDTKSLQAAGKRVQRRKFLRFCIQPKLGLELRRTILWTGCTVARPTHNRHSMAIWTLHYQGTFLTLRNVPVINSRKDESVEHLCVVPTFAIRGELSTKCRRAAVCYGTFLDALDEQALSGDRLQCHATVITLAPC